MSVRQRFRARCGKEVSELKYFSVQKIRERGGRFVDRCSRLPQQKRWKGCGSDSPNGAGKKLEAGFAVVQHGELCATEESVERDCDGELQLCTGRRGEEAGTSF